MVNRTSVASNTITESQIAAMFSGNLSEDEADYTLVEHPSSPLPPYSPPLSHNGKCIRRFGGIYAYCRYFIDRKW